jgi:pimeloyl-ACP methyl ester carboxylesterase
MLESIGVFQNDSAGESYMFLHVSELGQASDQPPLIILHGFLGSSDNWHTPAWRLSDYHHVFTLDARNHGRSPHSEEFTYTAMVNDVREFIEREDFASINLLGDSWIHRKSEKHFTANVYKFTIKETHPCSEHLR